MLQRALVIARGAAVQGEQAHELVEAIPVEVLDRVRGTQMQLLPATLEQAVVGGLANQRVLEAVGGLGLAAGVAQEVRRLQVCEGTRRATPPSTLSTSPRLNRRPSTAPARSTS